MFFLIVVRQEVSNFDSSVVVREVALAINRAYMKVYIQIKDKYMKVRQGNKILRISSVLLAYIS